MIDNRMWLRCKVCNERFLLFANHPSGWVVAYERLEEFGPHLQRWFESHYHGHPAGTEIVFGSEDQQNDPPVDGMTNAWTRRHIEPHEHEWQIDLDNVMLDIGPPLYLYRCACGATKHDQ